MERILPCSRAEACWFSRTALVPGVPWRHPHASHHAGLASLCWISWWLWHGGGIAFSGAWRIAAVCSFFSHLSDERPRVSFTHGCSPQTMQSM